MGNTSYNVASHFTDEEALIIVERIRNASAEMDSLSLIMKEEFEFFQAGRHLSNTQLWRRLLLRNSFCSIQASMNLMKYFVDIFSKIRPGKITYAERAILFEENYSLTDSGKAKIRPNFQELAKSTKFIFNIFSHVVLFDNFQLDTGKYGWQCYMRSIKVRNRLTHPKSITDLVVNDAELARFFTAWDWYASEFQRLWILMEDRAKKTYREVNMSDLSAKETLSVILKIYC